MACKSVAVVRAVVILRVVGVELRRRGVLVREPISLFVVALPARDNALVPSSFAVKCIHATLKLLGQIPSLAVSLNNRLWLPNGCLPLFDAVPFLGLSLLPHLFELLLQLFRKS